eukprot:symbB.v1.2.026457.t1/scaffold2647.1/size76802/2
MGGKVSNFNSTCGPSACCVPPDQVGNVVVNTPIKTFTKPGFLSSSDEGLSSNLEFTTPDVGVVETPETTHPVAVNSFDKLTRIHTQIHKHLEKQEMLIAQLLQDDDFTQVKFRPVDRG